MPWRALQRAKPVSHIRNAAVCFVRSVHSRLTWVRRMLSWASCWALEVNWALDGKAKVGSSVTAIATSSGRLP